MKTHLPKADSIERSWHILDASEKPLGRLASEAAQLLTGKHRPDYTAHLDVGDYVVIVNAKDIQLTGNKAETKAYYTHSRYPGGIKKRTFAEQMEKDSTEVVRRAVKGMLPKNRLQDGRVARLKVYAGAEHIHQAQLSN